LLTIHSSNSNRTLRIEPSAGAYLIAKLEGHEVLGVVEVWAETGDVAGLTAFFGELGRIARPWKGARKWGSLESDLHLSATCASLGAVTFLVSMTGLPGGGFERESRQSLGSLRGSLRRRGR
jgi:hypothetical protein